jgi:hypothetical protein
MAKTYNFPPHTKGDTFQGKTFTVTLNTELVDTASYNVKMQVRKSPAADAVLTFDSTANPAPTITKGAGGAFTLVARDINIDAGKYIYDIQFTEVGGDEKVHTWIKGIWKINKEITTTA